MQPYEPRDISHDLARMIVNAGKIIFEEMARVRIGINDISTEGDFVFESDGEAIENGHPGDPFGWAFMQPNNFNGSEDCVEIRPEFDYKWLVPIIIVNYGHSPGKSRI